MRPVQHHVALERFMAERRRDVATERSEPIHKVAATKAEADALIPWVQRERDAQAARDGAAAILRHAAPAAPTATATSAVGGATQMRAYIVMAYIVMAHTVGGATQMTTAVVAAGRYGAAPKKPTWRPPMLFGTENARTTPAARDGCVTMATTSARPSGTSDRHAAAQPEERTYRIPKKQRGCSDAPSSTGHNYIGHNYIGHNYIGHNY